MAERRVQRRVGLPALLPYLREHRGTLIVVGSLSLVTAVAALVQPVLIRTVLDGISAGTSIGGAVALLVALLLTGAAIDGFRDFLLQRTAEGLVLTTRRRLARHLLRLPIAEYDTRRTGDLLSRVGADTTLLRAVVTSGLFEIVTGAVMVVGATIAMALLDPLLLGVAAAGLAVGLTVAITVSRRVRGLSEQAQARLGEMTSAVERSLSAARTIRASGAEDREAETVGRSATEAYDAGMRVARLRALIGPASTAATQGAFLLVLGVGGARVAAGAISVGDLVAFILFLFFLVLPLGQALNAYTQLQTGLGALQRIEEILDLPSETAEDRPAQAGSGSAEPAIVFENVTFGYPGGGTPVLQDVSFTVPAGSRVALVGPSGAGKSTVLALIERFYEVTSGTIRVGGTDIRDLPRDALRRRLGYVEQEAPVLAGTLRDNLLLTAPGADEARLLRALDEVNLGALATRTPDGLDVQVGEGGVLLSGGERQRLAIARTLLADAPILLLDEPTSNLDARNEAALREAIAAASFQRTLVVVAHRLSTVVDSDQIVVVEAGRVVATGPHRELLETSPLYRELATHQLLVS
ncbi:ABC transporter ATP-binding protein [Actinoplanes friuliensis]|uniref:ABC transporter n=1 Tax=Actinoplanes friuliensis DSM 7358 TaxID=1246995 RepID=U5W341_9ACTN|nr:ABC transporter ATP-binding protein [Actinoplanes friuliensis]AGZ43618.1 ABC transporter [Actinoplanes friuliensis DSM 7358]